MNEPTEIVKINPVQTLSEYSTERNSMIKLVKDKMRENTDYGIIPGTAKKSLYQPGAEKLAKFFGLISEFELIKEVEDFEKNFFYYKYRCSLIHFATGKSAGSSERSCNNKEKKYLARGADIINTLQAMAQKRALVAAVRTATMATEIFGDHESDEEEQPSETQQKQKLNAKLFACASERGFSAEQIKALVKKKYSLESLTDASEQQLREAIETLMIDWKVVDPGSKPTRYISIDRSEQPVISESSETDTPEEDPFIAELEAEKNGSVDSEADPKALDTLKAEGKLVTGDNFKPEPKKCYQCGKVLTHDREDDNFCNEFCQNAYWAEVEERTKKQK